MTKISIVIAFALAILFAVAQNAVINRGQSRSDKIGKKSVQNYSTSSIHLDSIRSDY